MANIVEEEGIEKRELSQFNSMIKVGQGLLMVVVEEGTIEGRRRRETKFNVLFELFCVGGEERGSRRIGEEERSTLLELVAAFEKESSISFATNYLIYLQL